MIIFVFVRNLNGSENRPWKVKMTDEEAGII